MTTASTLMISKKAALLFGMLAVTILLLNLMLVQQNRDLKAHAKRVDQLIELNPGTRLPAIEGSNAEGNKIRVGYERETRRTLLLVYSPQCGSCTENMPVWHTLLRRADRDSVRIVGLSILASGAIDYARKHDLNGIETLTEISPKVRTAYRLNLTPQTILISPDGVVEKVWSGVLGDEEREEIERWAGPGSQR